MTYTAFTVPKLSKVELSLSLPGNPPRKIYSTMEGRISVYCTLPSDSFRNTVPRQLLEAVCSSRNPF